MPDKHTSSALVPTLSQEVHQLREAMEDNPQQRQRMVINPNRSASSLAMACLNSPVTVILPHKAKYHRADISSLSMELPEDTKLLLQDTQRLVLRCRHPELKD
jgi:hypothetical protein